MLGGQRLVQQMVGSGILSWGIIVSAVRTARIGLPRRSGSSGQPIDPALDLATAAGAYHSIHFSTTLL